jgi:hypothetical protein
MAAGSQDVEDPIQHLVHIHRAFASAMPRRRDHRCQRRGLRFDASSSSCIAKCFGSSAMMKFAGGLEEQSPRSRRRADGSGEAASFAVVINTSMDYAPLDRLSHSRSRSRPGSISRPASVSWSCIRHPSFGHTGGIARSTKEPRKLGMGRAPGAHRAHAASAARVNTQV